MTEPDLKPCPFCGWEAWVEHHRLGGNISYSARCGRIGCRLAYTRHLCITEKVAIEEWNTRHNPPGLAWTKTPPTEKDVRKFYVAKWYDCDRWLTACGVIGKPAYESEEMGLIIHSPPCFVRVNWLIEHNAEFLGPLPE